MTAPHDLNLAELERRAAGLIEMRETAGRDGLSKHQRHHAYREFHKACRQRAEPLARDAKRLIAAVRALRKILSDLDAELRANCDDEFADLIQGDTDNVLAGIVDKEVTP